MFKFRQAVPKVRAVHFLVIAALALMGLGIGFAMARQGTEELVVAANPNEEREPGWFIPLLREDREKPRLDTSLAGIRIGPNLEVDASSICQEVRGRYVELSEAARTPLDVKPTYLPTGTTTDGEWAIRCGPGAGTLILVSKEYYVPADRTLGRYGGHLEISRRPVIGEPSIQLDVPAERARTDVVGGNSAIVVRPITRDGFGDSAVVIHEANRITRITADGITEEELLRIAEGLYR